MRDTGTLSKRARMLFAVAIRACKRFSLVLNRMDSNGHEMEANVCLWVLCESASSSVDRSDEGLPCISRERIGSWEDWESTNIGNSRALYDSEEFTRLVIPTKRTKCTKLMFDFALRQHRKDSCCHTTDWTVKENPFSQKETFNKMKIEDKPLRLWKMHLNSI